MERTFGEVVEAIDENENHPFLAKGNEVLKSIFEEFRQCCESLNKMDKMLKILVSESSNEFTA